MSTATAAVIENHSHSAGDLALASVGGGSARAIAAANALLNSFADEKGLSQQRAVAVNDNQAKDTAALFAVQFGAAGLNFANISQTAEVKIPASAPNVIEKSAGQSV